MAELGLPVFYDRENNVLCAVAPGAFTFYQKLIKHLFPDGTEEITVEEGQRIYEAYCYGLMAATMIKEKYTFHDVRNMTPKEWEKLTREAASDD